MATDESGKNTATTNGSGNAIVVSTSEGATTYIWFRIALEVVGVMAIIYLLIAPAHGTILV